MDRTIAPLIIGALACRVAGATDLTAEVVDVRIVSGQPEDHAGDLWRDVQRHMPAVAHCFREALGETGELDPRIDFQLRLADGRVDLFAPVHAADSDLASCVAGVSRRWRMERTRASESIVSIVSRSSPPDSSASRAFGIPWSATNPHAEQVTTHVVSTSLPAGLPRVRFKVEAHYAEPPRPEGPISVSVDREDLSWSPSTPLDLLADGEPIPRGPTTYTPYPDEGRRGPAHEVLTVPVEPLALRRWLDAGTPTVRVGEVDFAVNDATLTAIRRLFPDGLP